VEEVTPRHKHRHRITDILLLITLLILAIGINLRGANVRVLGGTGGVRSFVIGAVRQPRELDVAVVTGRLVVYLTVCSILGRDKNLSSSTEGHAGYGTPSA
jgi:hypothetical protein